MKASIFFIALGLAVSLQAQQPADSTTAARHGRHHQSIEKMVSDLSAPQKKKLETLKKESHQRIRQLRQSKHAVSDSINALMNLDGDHSQQLDPLFQREADLQVKISKEMYSTRIAVDKILTDKQRKEMKENMKKMKEAKKNSAKHRKVHKSFSPAHPDQPMRTGTKVKHDCKKDASKKDACKKADAQK